MNATDKALQAVLARASVTDRQLAALQAGLEEERRLREEDKVRHNLEREEEKKRISDLMASAALVQGNILAEILARMKEQREETRDIKSRLSGGPGPQSTPMVFSPEWSILWPLPPLVGWIFCRTLLLRCPPR